MKVLCRQSQRAIRNRRRSAVTVIASERQNARAVFVERARAIVSDRAGERNRCCHCHQSFTTCGKRDRARGEVPALAPVAAQCATVKDNRQLVGTEGSESTWIPPCQRSELKTASKRVVVLDGKRAAAELRHRRAAANRVNPPGCNSLNHW